MTHANIALHISSLMHAHSSFYVFEHAHTYTNKLFHLHSLTLEPLKHCFFFFALLFRCLSYTGRAFNIIFFSNKHTKTYQMTTIFNKNLVCTVDEFARRNGTFTFFRCQHTALTIFCSVYLLPCCSEKPVNTKPDSAPTNDSPVSLRVDATSNQEFLRVHIR